MVTWARKHVAETTTREDNLFTGTFGIVYRGVRVDLSGADSSNEGADGREKGVEPSAIASL